jgi:hypothetical protein
MIENSRTFVGNLPCVINIGDRVIDARACIGEQNTEGEFTVEEINDIGWVWGSDMQNPYYNGKKSFLSNSVIRKL